MQNAVLYPNTETVVFMRSRVFLDDSSDVCLLPGVQIWNPTYRAGKTCHMVVSFGTFKHHDLGLPAAPSLQYVVAHPGALSIDVLPTLEL